MANNKSVSLTDEVLTSFIENNSKLLEEYVVTVGAGTSPHYYSYVIFFSYNIDDLNCSGFEHETDPKKFLDPALFELEVEDTDVDQIEVLKLSEIVKETEDGTYTFIDGNNCPAGRAFGNSIPRAIKGFKFFKKQYS